MRILLSTLFLGLITVSISAQKPKYYTLKVGDQFKVTAEVKQNINQTMLGQKMTTKQTITTVDRYEVVEATSQGFKFKTTGLSRSLYTESGQGSVSMDSDLEGDDHLAFRVLTGKSYYVNMNKYGRFLSFEGMDEFRQAVKEELRGTTLEASTNDLLASFKEETLGTAFDGQFFIYQEPGQPWNRKAQMTVNNLPISVDYQFSRKGPTEIEAVGDMTLDGEFEVMGQMMSASLAGDQVSIFTLDSKTGLSMNIKTTQNMEGTLKVEDLSVPMDLETIVTVTITK